MGAQEKLDKIAFILDGIEVNDMTTAEHRIYQIVHDKHGATPAACERNTQKLIEGFSPNFFP